MLKLFRPAAALPKTGLAMIDPRPGNAVLFVGASAPTLAGETGAVTGLNGRTVVVAENTSSAPQIERAAQASGALVEFTHAPLESLPFAAGIFDIVVAAEIDTWPAGAEAGRMSEIARVAAPGGRIILTVRRPRRGLLWARPAPPNPAEPDSTVILLQRTGVVAARRIATANGVAYYEARKPR